MDAARSARLAADAWVAPAKTYRSSYNGLNNISRESVVRTASVTHSDPLDVVTRETQKALQNGWVLTYAHCGSVARPMSSASAPQTLSGVEVNLEKSPTDPENAAIAQLTAYRVAPDPDGQGWSTWRSTPSRDITRIGAGRIYRACRWKPRVWRYPARLLLVSMRHRHFRWGSSRV